MFIEEWYKKSLLIALCIWLLKNIWNMPKIKGFFFKYICRWEINIE